MNATTRRVFDIAMALCLFVMAAAVFVNVVLRYGFGSGIAASEELSRLLFVWMVFIGAAAGYPAGEHMAFTGLLPPLERRFGTRFMRVVATFIHACVLLGCVLLGWGAWQQVVVGMGSTSVVLGYPTALLPLPALLCAVAIGVVALKDLVKARATVRGHEGEVE
jgi:TRAP-type C4-dicarboxylate transport system permease small subunit